MRKLTVIVDEVGNMGKSTLVKYMKIYDGVCVVGGKQSDMGQLFQNFYTANGFPSIVFIDVTRSIEQYISWAGIEMILNGSILGTKYEGFTADGRPPHVVMFTNRFPDQTVMSADRWRIIDLNAGSQLRGLGGTLYRKIDRHADFGSCRDMARPVIESYDEDESNKITEDDMNEVIDLLADEDDIIPGVAIAEGIEMANTGAGAGARACMNRRMADDGGFASQEQDGFQTMGGESAEWANHSWPV